MNALAHNLKSLPNLIRNLTIFESKIARNYAFKSDLKIKWVRPEKIPCYKPEKSGDLGLELDVSPKDLAENYSKSIELRDADENVKKLFTLEYLPAWNTTVVRSNRALNLVRRHGLDRGSMEVKLAVMTNWIQLKQKRMEENPRDKRCKVRLKELIDKRKKFLGYLRKWDYRRFEWILERLNLIYKPHPHQYLPVWRKDSLRKLTDKHCDKIVQEKLDAYKKELVSQQKEFFKEKAEKLAFVREQELFCGVTPSVSEEEIEEAKKKYESIQ